MAENDCKRWGKFPEGFDDIEKLENSGLMSVSIERDHVFMNLLENALSNLGNNEINEGVPRNLLAYACKLSFQKGLESFEVFTAKSKLIKHYEDALGVYYIKNHLIVQVFLTWTIRF